MNALLWGLDLLARTAVSDLAAFKALKVEFRKPIYLDEEIQAKLIVRNFDKTRLDLLSGNEVLVTILLRATAERAAATIYGDNIAAIEPRGHGPRELELDEMARRAGKVRLPPPSPEADASYPAAVACLGRRRVATLAALSFLVGMECPGLHSLFVEAELAFASEGSSDGLLYAVREVDERFQIVRMIVGGGGWHGSVAARVRTKPALQPTIAELAELVGPEEFAGQSPLIIGGSRGLGELTAKIYVAGGARPTISYCVGKADAERLAQEVAERGGSCSIIHYDARLPAEPQLQPLSLAPSQVYYFATGPIGQRKSRLVETRILQEFLACYVTGFYDLCEAVRARATKPVAVFYPSTTYLDQRPRDMTEYALAKAAGEIVCADLTRFMRGLTVISRRLPPLLTDQTAAMSKRSLSTPATTLLLPIIREMVPLRASPALKLLPADQA